MKLSPVLSILSFLAVSSAVAQDCRVIFHDGYHAQIAEALSKKGFELVDEEKLNDASAVPYRIYNNFERRYSSSEVRQVMRFNRDLKTLVAMEYPGSREWASKFQLFLETLPNCDEISQLHLAR